MGLLFGFGLLLGLAVAPTVSYYVDADPRAVWLAGGATALFIAGFGAAGCATRRDLSALARYLFWALAALIAFGIVLVFVQIPGGALIYAIAGLVIFAGLTLFDFQRLRRSKDIRTARLLAASIFLDILNVFLLLLSIFGRATSAARVTTGAARARPTLVCGMQMAGVWPRLLDAASWAPSPHNTQPWLVHARSDTEAELYVSAGRTLPYTDASGAFTTSALGIFVEALDVAAAAEGLAVEAEPLYPKLGAESEERPLFARLQLAERSEPPRFPVELLARRQTARGAYDPRPADEAALAALQAIAREAGHEAWFTSDRELVDWAVGLNADTLFYDLDDDRTRAEIGRWIRTSQAEARRTGDGFSPASLGFPGPLIGLFFFHHRLFASRPVRSLVRRLFLWTTRGTATVGWLRGPWELPQDWFAAGRMLMRFWLELTRCGLYLQPFGSVITNPTAHALMAERLQVDERSAEVWLLLRIGYCRTPPRSLRRPTAEVLI